MSTGHDHNDAHGHDDHHGVGHIVPLRFLIAVGAALMVLTWLTVAVTAIDLGEMNVYIAMGIATVKATLVCLFFMHLAWDKPFNAVIFVSSVLGVGLFIAFALTDMHEYRHEVREFNRIELLGGDAQAVQDKLAETQTAIEAAREAGDHDHAEGDQEND